MDFTKKLKKALNKAGLAEELSEFITITSESDIEGAIKLMSTKTVTSDELDFNTILASPEFASFAKKKGIEEMLKGSKAFHREFDKKVTEGIKTFKKKFVNDELEDDNDDEGQEGKIESDNDMPAWAKEIRDEMRSMKAGSTKATKLEQAKGLFEKSEILKKLPEKLQEKWLDRIKTDSETSFEDQIKGLEEEMSELNVSGPTVSKGLPTGGSGSTGKITEEEAESIVDDLV